MPAGSCRAARVAAVRRGRSLIGMSGRFRCSAVLYGADIRPATQRAAEQKRLRHWSLDSWIRFFATRPHRLGEGHRGQLTDLLAVHADLKAKVRSAGLRAENARALVDYALAQPIFTVRQVQRHLGVTYARANGLVGQLVAAGVLRQYDDAVYDREFTAPDVLAVLLR